MNDAKKEDTPKEEPKAEVKAPEAPKEEPKAAANPKPKKEAKPKVEPKEDRVVGESAYACEVPSYGLEEYNAFAGEAAYGGIRDTFSQLSFLIKAARELGPYVKQLQDSKNLREAVQAVCNLLEAGAGMTSTLVDDQAVAAIKRITGTALFDVLVAYVENLMKNKPALGDVEAVQVYAAEAAKREKADGSTILLVLSLAQLVARILGHFKK